MQRRRQQQRRQRQASGASEPRQKVDKNEAINTLHAMFEHVDREVIKMVLLESCSGNMEAAVEALLIMSGGDSGPSQPQAAPQHQQPQPPAQPAYGYPQGAPGAQLRRVEAQQAQLQQQQAYAAQLQQQYMQRGARAQSQPQPRPQPQPQPQPQARASLSVNLPDDFLRPPSYFLNKYDDPELESPDAQSERERQIVEDELFAKQLFESSLFASDLAAHPEWVTDDSVAAPKPSKQLSRARARSANASSEQSTSKFKKIFRRRSSQTAVPTASPTASPDESPGPQEVDPTNPMERQKSFKAKVNSLGRGAKERLAIFAEKLKRHKEGKNRTKTVTYNSHKYHSALSLDDEPLLEDDLGPVEQASESNRGTYVPPKPSQDL